MNRCFLPPDRWKPGHSLQDREAHHLIHVLRIHPGDKVLCLDGEGRAAEAIVKTVRRSAVILDLGEPYLLPKPLIQITLAVAVPGQGKLDAIISAASQLGAERIIPMITQRCVVRLSEERFRRKQEHLHQVAVEALKQSGSGWLTAIDPFTLWDDVVSTFSEYTLVLVAAVEGPYELCRDLLASRPRRILLLVGPEGDLAPEEIRHAVEAGAHRMSLGSTILRTDTACTAALAILNFFAREGAP